MVTLEEHRANLAKMTPEGFEWAGGPDREHLPILMFAWRFWCKNAPDGDAGPLMPFLMSAWPFWCKNAPDADFEDVLDELVEMDFHQQWREQRAITQDTEK